MANTTSPITVMLGRLEKVIDRGGGQYSALCPARDDLLAALHEASGAGIDKSQLDGRTGDELLGVYLCLKNGRR